MRSSLASRLCAIGAPLFLLLSAASHANDDRATVTVTAALPTEQFFENAALSGVLLAHGQLDRRIAASDAASDAASLYQAIRQGNPNAEWLRYDDEGQGLTLPGNRIDFWRKVEQFLARHNAPPLTPDPAQP
ncbi:alpha/beta hydrolase family protein [Janthinobacterium violaceinigrum]|uniref:Peptidase S9 prolyl oligopeptidase catalytic domain-containing protein n=1 Tax=Janthinobacterium violaceinigrum TaxID=2654252 RepID=A0A6I1HYR8_9BURK|nr:hypothetical protein [Janthinobacterium violaceinigrum]KAB8062810.1 hypothetical protein GCN75_21360 [Janthinobacterium violaceinigrum]